MLPYRRRRVKSAMDATVEHLKPKREGGPDTVGNVRLAHMVCNNALGAWTLELAARGKGDAAAIGTELRAHLLPGVTVVPAMVVAITQAQAAGISYNRQ